MQATTIQLQVKFILLNNENGFTGFSVSTTFKRVMVYYKYKYPCLSASCAQLLCYKPVY